MQSPITATYSAIGGTEDRNKTESFIAFSEEELSLAMQKFTELFLKVGRAVLSTSISKDGRSRYMDVIDTKLFKYNGINFLRNAGLLVTGEIDKQILVKQKGGMNYGLEVFVISLCENIFEVFYLKVQKQCDNCKILAPLDVKFKYCGRCTRSYYCSEECQLKHRKEHKTFCKSDDAKTFKCETSLRNKTNHLCVSYRSKYIDKHASQETTDSFTFPTWYVKPKNRKLLGCTKISNSPNWSSMGCADHLKQFLLIVIQKLNNEKKSNYIAFIPVR